MPALDDVVRYENETTTLDFKAVQYGPDKSEALLKDVLSMANADAAEDRLIVCGVKLHADGRDIRGIDPATLTDSAEIQQLVHQNVEPDVHLEYEAHEIDGKCLAVLRIFGCTERPYAMRKDYGKGLRQGDMWVRKGSHAMRMTRADLERIYAARQATAGPLRLGFDLDGVPPMMTLPSAAGFDLPSDRARRKIEAVLESRRKPVAAAGVGAFAIQSFGYAFGSGLANQPYDARPTEELVRDLAAVEETYREDDEYELWTRYAHRVNLAIRLDGTVTLDDLRFDAEMPTTPGLAVASGAPRRPRATGWHALSGAADAYETLENLRTLGGPSVRTDAEATRVTHTLRSVRHQATHRVFEQPLWIFLGPNAVGREVPLACTIRARNLPNPYRTTLVLRVAEPDGSLPHAASDD